MMIIERNVNEEGRGGNELKNIHCHFCIIVFFLEQGERYINVKILSQNPIMDILIGNLMQIKIISPLKTLQLMF